MTSPQRTTTAQAARTGAACAGVVSLALALAGCSVAGATAVADAGPAPAPMTADGPALDRRAEPRGPAVARQVPVRPALDAPAPPPPGPVRVEVPALGIDVPVEPTGVDDAGRMALPDSADVAGWYRFGPAPRSPSGAIVVAAHVDDADSVGPFARLAGADAGTAVRVTTADGAAQAYRVTEVRSEAKHALSSDALFDRSGNPRLVLVTCGGDWDPEAASYTDNVVVTAVPEGR